MIGVLLSHEIRIHNIALESEIILIGVLLSHETRIHNITLECKYYCWCAVRREEVQRKCNVTPLDFYNTYDPREFCEWIVHLYYYFDLYELSEVHRVWFSK